MYYWIGLNDLAEEGYYFILDHVFQTSSIGDFKWAESHQATEYTNWQDGEPSNDYDGHDCVITYTPTYSVRGWDDIDCNLDKNSYGDGLFALCKRKYT